ncbi:MAG: secretin N-terminal domain-containing protein [bacterium]
MKKLIQYIIAAIIIFNIALAGTISKVEIKEIDSTVKISVNTLGASKPVLSGNVLTVRFKDSNIDLSQTEANLMPGGPVSKVEVSEEGKDSLLKIYLNYDAINFKLFESSGFTVIEIKEKNPPEPVGPKTVYSEKQNLRNYIVLSSAQEQTTANKEESKVESKEEPKVESKVEVKAPKVTTTTTKATTTKTTTTNKTTTTTAKTTKSMPTKVSTTVSGKTITLDLVDATLVDTVRLIADTLGWNVLFSPEVQKYSEKITTKLVNVDAEQALKMILLSNGFDYKIVNKIAYVAPKDKLAQFQQDVKVSGPMKTQVINLENASAKEIEPVIKSSYPEATVQVVEKTNSLLIKAPVETIREIKNLVGQLDVPPPPPPPVTPPTTEVIRLNYANAQDVVGMMGGLVPKEAIAIDQRMNSLIVTATPDIIDTVKSFVKAVDVPMPQVALRLHVILVDMDNSKNLGVDWFGSETKIALSEGKKGIDPGPDKIFGTRDDTVTIKYDDSDYLGIQLFTRSMLKFQAILSYSVSSGIAKVLAAPYVMTQNKQQANIQIGSQIPILYTDYRTGQVQANYINVGIILNVTPEISPDGYVTISLNPQISELGQQIPGTQYYIINTRNAQATVRVKEKETVLIGGLFRELNTDSVKKVPLLSDIPIIGEIFKSRSKIKQRQEMIIAITPVVMMDLPKIEESIQYKEFKDKGVNIKDPNKF